jgi:stage V sporulation protein G
MEIKVSRIFILENSTSKVKAFADITIDDCFVVKGFNVVDGVKGLFVSMPQKKVKEEYQDQAHPITKEARAMLFSAVLDAYKEKLANPDKYKKKDSASEEPETDTSEKSSIPF